MASARPLPAEPSPPASRLIEPLDPAELARRNADAIALLERWDAEGDEQEQRETLAVLREALGPGRSASSRPVFAP